VPLTSVGLERMVMCHSELIPPDVESSMEHAKNVDVPVLVEQVCDPILFLKEDTNVPR
jgi:hypothetical protein